MKKFILLVILTLLISVLGACSSPAKKNSLQVTDQNKPFLVKYDKTLREDIKEMNKQLETFNDGLDGIYTQQMSADQFATLLTDNINKSNDLVNKVEGLDVDPQLFQQHQLLIALVNRSHQLFLNAVDMAKQNNFDKNALRTEYVAIQGDQANLVNQWKILMQNLNSSNNTNISTNLSPGGNTK